MDSVKSSGTSVSAVGGYGVISYRTFSATSGLDTPCGRAAELEGLSSVEARLREAKRLVFLDRAKLLLWLFEPGTNPPAVDHGSLQRQQLNGLQLLSQSEGGLKAADLAKLAGRTPGFSASQSGGPSGSGANVRAIQAANARTFQSNTQTGTPGSNNPDTARQTDPLAVYESFMSAVIASVSYHLSLFHHMIPLNYRTFISYPRAMAAIDGGDDDDYDQSLLGETNCLLTTLDAHLSTAGTLVISTSVSRSTNVYQLEKFVSLPETSDDFLGELIRIAPCGIIARYIGPDTSMVASDRDVPAPLNRSRVSHQWKAEVLRWLRRKGISLPHIDGEKWVRIQLQCNSSTPKAENMDLNSPPYRECFWPSTLCFFYGSDRGNAETIGLQGLRPGIRIDDQEPDSGVRWWQGSGQKGFRDPLRQASNWFLGKPEREKAVEARKKARHAQEENAHAAPEITTAYPSSPLYSRGSAYGDVQAASGVYPTPPDGVLAPNAGGPAAMDGIIMASATTDGHSVHGQGNTNSDGVALREQSSAAGVTPGEHQDHLRNVDTPAAGQSAEADGNDDLFEDIDEEMFGGTNVTEADFNFFDDSNAADFGDFMDVSQPPVFEEPNNDPSHADLKFDGISPVASNPVGTKMDNEQGETAGFKPEPDAEPTATTTDVQMSEVEDFADAAEAPMEEAQAVDESNSDGAPEVKVQTPRQPSPPLSPSQINQKLFPSPQVVEADSEVKDLAKPRLQKTGTLFDAVDFSQKMQLTDSKYGADGRFDFSAASRKDTLTHKDDALGASADSDPKTLSIRLPPLSNSSAKYVTHEGVSNIIRSIMIPAHIREEFNIDSGVSEDSDSYSDLSTSTASFEEESRSAILPQDPNLLALGQKRWTSSSIGTPIVSTPGGMQLDATNPDIAMGDSDSVVSDVPSLSSLEPGPSDWSLANLPPPHVKPRQRPTVAARSRRGSFSLSSAASTPSSDGRSEIIPDTPSLNVREIINITQILAEQVIRTTLDLLPEDTDMVSPAAEHIASTTRGSGPMQTVQNAVKELFQQAYDCDMLKYASVQDAMPEPPASAKAQPKPVQRRNNQDPHGNMFFPIQTPHVRLRRGEDTWDVLPPALSFWEPLGLAPTSGAKNVVAYCVYPSSEQLNDPVASFLDSISMAYESCKFGMHIRGPDMDNLGSDGLVPASFSSSDSESWKATIQTCLQSMRDVCSSLGKCLAKVDFKKHAKPEDSPKVDAVVIYLVNPFSDPQNLWQLCSAFWALFQAYAPPASARTMDDSKPDVVLQLVPIKYIASFDAPVILEPCLLTRLAREVYDRCPPKGPNEDHTSLSIYSAPSIQLEETLPKSIPFRITVEPPSDLLHENSYMHVAYSIGFDGSWLTAAWTDNPGKHQATVSYCLVNRSFAEVAREIYQTSLEIMLARRVTWRLCIAKAGVMEREEMDVWQALVTSSCPLVIGTALISVDPSPPFSMTSTLPALTSTPGQPPASHGVSTPGNTPQPGVSPDQHGFTPAPTPSDSTGADPASDPDARLVDVTDDSWGVILAHRLHNSNSSVEYRPALASGYLIKRGTDSSDPTAASPKDADDPGGPIAVGVNLLWIGSTAGGHQPQRATPTAAHNPNISINLQHLEAAAQGGASSPLTSPGGVPGVSVGGVSPFANQAARTTYDTVLREFLITYRGLGLLAKLKGMKGTRGGTVPWHVAAAIRGVRALERCM